MTPTPKDPKKETAASADAKKRPAKVFRIEDVSVSIFAHERDDGARNFSFNFQRSYRDRTQTWKRTQWFGLDDLGKLITLAEQANDWAREQLGKAA